eukprot:scaffold2059_cov106-Isochrysis_galbana.AAC.7
MILFRRRSALFRASPPTAASRRAASSSPIPRAAKSRSTSESSIPISAHDLRTIASFQKRTCAANLGSRPTVASHNTGAVDASREQSRPQAADRSIQSRVRKERSRRISCSYRGEAAAAAATAALAAASPSPPISAPSRHSATSASSTSFSAMPDTLSARSALPASARFPSPVPFCAGQCRFRNWTRLKEPYIAPAVRASADGDTWTSSCGGLSSSASGREVRPRNSSTCTPANFSRADSTSLPAGDNTGSAWAEGADVSGSACTCAAERLASSSYSARSGAGKGVPERRLWTTTVPSSSPSQHSRPLANSVLSVSPSPTTTSIGTPRSRVASTLSATASSASRSVSTSTPSYSPRSGPLGTANTGAAISRHSATRPQHGGQNRPKWEGRAVGDFFFVASSLW